MEKKMKKWFGLGALFLLLTLAGCGEGTASKRETIPEFVLTYAENQAEDYPTTRGARRFAELVEKRTGGRIVIQVHPAAQLGDELSVAEQLRFGGIDLARLSLSSITDMIPQLYVLQLPYLYTSEEHMRQVLEGEIGQKVVKNVEDYDMIPLSWYYAGARSFYTTKKPIKTLEDMEGLRIRVQESHMLEDAISALGAVPVPMAFDEVYSALEKGICDGAENNWPSYDSMGHYEAAPYFTLSEHARIPELQLISAATWEKLSDEDRRIIKGCARESADYERRLWKEQESQSRKKVCEAGCQVTELSEAELERFQKAMEPVYKKYCPGQQEMIEKIKKLGENP